MRKKNRGKICNTGKTQGTLSRLECGHPARLSLGLEAREYDPNGLTVNTPPPRDLVRERGYCPDGLTEPLHKQRNRVPPRSPRTESQTPVKTLPSFVLRTHWSGTDLYR